MPATVEVPDGAALGLLETFGLVAAIEAADAMLKASDVRLVRQQRTNPGLITHLVVGETAAVRAAIDAGTVAAERVGRVVATHVIPRPADDVWRHLVGVVPGETARPKAVASPVTKTIKAGSGGAPKKAVESGSDDYDSLTVRELRSRARDRDDDRLRGRDIASASKSDLVAFLRTLDAER